MHIFWGWIIKLLIISIGVAIFYGGIRLTEDEHRKAVYSELTPGSEHALGCMMSLIYGLIVGALMRLVPVWMIRVIRVLLGIGIILVGILVPAR